jgi:hypothetical protein
MDPYLEGYLWPDVHQRLANAIAELLAPDFSVEDQAWISEDAVSTKLKNLIFA